MIRRGEGDLVPFISIATFIVAISFALTCIYIAKILLRITTLIGTVGRTASKVEQQLDESIYEVGEFISQSEKTTVDLEQKLKATDGLFHSLQNFGDATAIMSKDIQEHTDRYEKNASSSGSKKFVQAIQFSVYANVLFKSWQRGKRASL